MTTLRRHRDVQELLHQRGIEERLNPIVRLFRLDAMLRSGDAMTQPIVIKLPSDQDRVQARNVLAHLN